MKAIFLSLMMAVFSGHLINTAEAQEGVKTSPFANNQAGYTTPVVNNNQAGVVNNNQAGYTAPTNNQSRERMSSGLTGFTQFNSVPGKLVGGT